MSRVPETQPAGVARREPGRPEDHAGWVGLIANPHSGRGRGVVLAADLERAFDRRGIAARCAWSPEERHGLVAGATAASHCRALVAIGGDGTVAALLNERPQAPVAVLPTGTENLVARHFGFDGKPERLAERIARGRTRPVDLGRADGRLFALMAGFGFDAEVVSRHHRIRMGRHREAATTSRAAYVEPIVRSSLTYRFPPLTVRAETDRGEETLTGTTVLIFNLPRYALGLPFAPDAADDDGWLDLLVFRKPGAWNALRYLWLVLWKLHLGRRGVEYRRVRRATVEAAEAVPVQLDGDPAGRVEPGPAGAWTVEVMPAAFEVVD